MHLEDYFDFLSPSDIRIRGHRIGIEDVLYEYIHRSRTPEQIAERFPTLHNREAVSTYLTDWLEHGEQARRAQEQDPAFQRLRERLRRVRAERLEREASTTGAS